MKFNVAICDDDEKSVELLRRYLKNVSIEHDIEFEISCFNSSRELLDSYKTPGSYHIVFLDVEMPRPNGIETARVIRRLPDRDVRIVFVSSYPSYMKESFDVQAFQYLSKPYLYEEFRTIVLQLQEDYKDSQYTCCLLNVDGLERLINIKDIIYIKATNAKKKLLEVTLKDEVINAYGSINEYEKLYADAGFVSPCRGILVNIQHIHYIKENMLVMNNQTEISLSRRREKMIKELFNQKLLVLRMKR